MESPSSWNFLTALIATSDLRDVRATWWRLVAARAVHAAAREEFFIAVAEVLAAEPVTGQSTASRIAARIAGFALHAGQTADPDAHRARRVGAGFAPLLGLFCGRCRSPVRDRDEQCPGCGRAAFDTVALLAELGLSSATMQLCPNCGQGHRDRFCYRCGAARP